MQSLAISSGHEEVVMALPPPRIYEKDALGRVTWALHRAAASLAAARDPALRSAGLAAAQYSLLYQVYSYPGLTGAEVARRLGVTAQAVAMTVKKLENLGMLERRPHPRHGHVQELHATPAGIAALGEGDYGVQVIERRLLDTLGPDDHRKLHDLLELVAKTLDG
jgi:DNA-binding MarR family transcriptional regulator